jgi:hypothetical protein
LWLSLDHLSIWPFNRTFQPSGSGGGQKGIYVWVLLISRFLGRFINISLWHFFGSPFNRTFQQDLSTIGFGWVSKRNICLVLHNLPIFREIYEYFFVTFFGSHFNRTFLPSGSGGDIYIWVCRISRFLGRFINISLWHFLWSIFWGPFYHRVRVGVKKEYMFGFAESPDF